MGNYFCQIFSSSSIKNNNNRQLIINKYTKTVVKKYNLRKKKESVQNELKMMSLFPQSTRFFLIAHSFSYTKNIYTFKYDLYGIDVFTFLTKYKYQLEDDIINNILFQIIQAVQYMHSHFITHNDLKFENILINPKTLQIKLIDFECCLFWNEPKQMYGTLSYVAPEIYLHDYEFEYMSGKQDIWSIGIMLYVLHKNEMPFEKRNYLKYIDYKQFISKIKKKEKTEGIQKIILKCLDLNPSLRINIFQLYDLFKIYIRGASPAFQPPISESGLEVGE